MAAYATESEFLSLGLPSEAVNTIGSSVIEAALEAASRMVDSYLSKRYPTPLTTWGQDVTRIVVDLSQYDLMCRRGFRPGSGADELVIKRRDDAIAWLDKAARKLVEPTGIEEPTPQVASPLVSSESKVNWAWQTRGR